MSETNIFGDDSMDFKSNFDNERVVTEAYDLISNAYGDACNKGSQLKDFMKVLNSEVGDLQGSLDNLTPNEIGSYKYFPAEEKHGHMVPEGFDAESDQPAKVAKTLQKHMREHLGEKTAQTAGNSGLEPVSPESDDNDDEQPEEQESDSNSYPVEEIPGVGSGNAEKVSTWFDTNPEAVSGILESADSVESFETVEVDKLAQVSGEERAEQLRSLFPDKSDKALIAFEQG